MKCDLDCDNARLAAKPSRICRKQTRAIPVGGIQRGAANGFRSDLFYDTPLYPYRRVAFGVAFIAFAALILLLSFSSFAESG
jgi:hypothetical protein